MILRSAPLSRGERVGFFFSFGVDMPQLSSAVEIANSYFYPRSVVQFFRPARIALLEKDQVSFEKLAQVGDDGHNVLRRVDQIADCVDDFDDQDDGVHNRYGQPYSRGSFRDLCGPSGFEFDAAATNEPEDLFPRADEDLEEFLGLCERPFDLDDALPESDILFKVSPSFELVVRRIEEIESCLVCARKMLDDVFGEVEQLLERRELPKYELKKLFNAHEAQNVIK